MSVFKLKRKKKEGKRYGHPIVGLLYQKNTWPAANDVFAAINDRHPRKENEKFVKQTNFDKNNSKSNTPISTYTSHSRCIWVL